MNPEFILDIKTICLCAILSYASVEIIKPINEIVGIQRHTPLHTLTTRILSLIIGVISGYFIYPALSVEETNHIIGIALGGSSGALNSYLVALIKKKIKQKGEPDNERNK